MGSRSAIPTRRVRGSYGGGFFFLLSVVSIMSLICGEWRRVDGFGSQYGLETSLLQADEDPFGERDSFESLPEKEKQRWARKTTSSAEAKRDALDELAATFSVEIKLVGFNGEGASPIKVREGDLEKYLHSLRLHEYVNVIKSAVHSLHVKNRLIFHVTKGSTQLTTELDHAVHYAVNKVGAMGSQHIAPVHYSIVDNIIQRDLDVQRPTFSIYILHLPQQSYRYGYYYNQDPPSMATCLGTHWMGKKRYVWIDVSAGPPLYGPRLSGDGFVGDTTIPRAIEYPTSQHSTVMLADLAALVGKAALHLFNPSMYRSEFHFRRNIEIRLFQIVVGQTKTDDQKLDWAAVKEEIGEKGADSLFFRGQTLLFSSQTMDFENCDFCAVAYARALKTFTNNMLHPVNGLMLEEYLDSKELHHWLSDYSSDIQQEIRNLHDVQELRHEEDLPGDSLATILPVFLFDVETDQPLLLDQEFQAVSFEDMVIAVRTKAMDKFTDFICNSDDQVIKISQKGVTRAVIAALTQTLWGVAPLHERWDPIHNTTKVDYLWSVGNTPFGKLSQLHTLSFVQRVAARRNMIVLSLSERLDDAHHILTAIEKYGGEHVVLHQEQHVKFTQRWNVFYHKIRKAVQLLSTFEFDHSFYFVQSAEHDILALDTIVRQSAASLETTLNCFKDAPIAYSKYLRILALLIGLVFVERTVRKRFFSKSKHKKF